MTCPFTCAGSLLSLMQLICKKRYLTLAICQIFKSLIGHGQQRALASEIFSQRLTIGLQ